MAGRLAAARAGFFATTIILVDGSPGAPLCFLLRHTFLLITFLDMVGLAFLLVRIGGLITSWHKTSLFDLRSPQRNCCGGQQDKRPFPKRSTFARKLSCTVW